VSGPQSRIQHLLINAIGRGYKFSGRDRAYGYFMSVPNVLSRFFVDRVHSLPRQWSNTELAKFGSFFYGNVVNVSGWKDIDKEGRHYRDYFPNCRSYSITNYREDHRGLQGFDNEIFLDLEADLDKGLVEAFDVVFNHTTLEHVFDFSKAFSNLCRMTGDVVVLVVPFVQQMHSGYGDFWRFSPMSVVRLFEENGLKVGYLSFNSHRNASVYIFAIATKNPSQWRGRLPFTVDYVDRGASTRPEPYAGCNAVAESWVLVLMRRLRGLVRGKS
jgi:hypothetical protein